MTGFEPWTSGIGSDRSTNWATTTAPNIQLLRRKSTKSYYDSRLQLHNTVSSNVSFEEEKVYLEETEEETTLLLLLDSFGRQKQEKSEDVWSKKEMEPNGRGSKIPNIKPKQWIAFEDNSRERERRKQKCNFLTKLSFTEIAFWGSYKKHTIVIF